MFDLNNFEPIIRGGDNKKNHGLVQKVVVLFTRTMQMKFYNKSQPKSSLIASQPKNWGDKLTNKHPNGLNGYPCMEVAPQPKNSSIIAMQKMLNHDVRI